MLQSRPSTDSACCDCTSPKRNLSTTSTSSDSTLVSSPTVATSPSSFTSSTKQPALQLTPSEQAARSAIQYALSTSSRLDKYTISQVLGFGSNGVVMAARENNSNTKLAIKIIYKSETVKRQSMGNPANLPHEIAVLRAITQQAPHQNVLRHYADWEDRLHYYLITELSTTDWLKAEALKGVETSSEFTFWNPRRMTKQSVRLTAGSADLWAWSIAQSYGAQSPPSTYIPSRSASKILFRDIALGLHHLHSFRIFHGDLKEENVLVSQLPNATKSHHVKALLADFGHARWIPESATNVNVMSRYGTAEMTPPELLSNFTSTKKVEVDPFKADVFALGLLLFMMVHGAGKLPKMVDATTLVGTASPLGYEELVASADDGAYPIEEDLNWDSWVGQDLHLLSLLRGLLMVDPAKRMSMEDVVHHPWFVSSLA